ncbi:MAG: hypothetical protein ACM3NF_09365 [Gemmatimonadota bacterium]
MATFRKSAFVRRFRARFFVRFHMALILVGTALAGLLVSKVLLEAGLGSMAVRYPLAVALAYLAFFAFVKIWLRYVAVASPGAGGRAGDAADFVPDVVDLRGAPASAAEKAIRFGGGRAGGGGAGGAFDAVAGATRGAAASLPETAAAEAAGDAAAGAGHAAGDAASGLLDADEWALPLVLLVALVAAVLGAGIYLVWQAPSILPDAAFDAALAASLLRGAKRASAPDWTAGIFRATWKPFLWVVAVTVAFALAAGHYFPHARKIADLFMRAG